MAREKGTFSPQDVKNLDGGGKQRLFDEKHTALNEKFGTHGVFNTEDGGDGSINWTFDYATKHNGDVDTQRQVDVQTIGADHEGDVLAGDRIPAKSHLGGSLTPEQVEAVNHVNVIAKNSGSIKMVDEEYVPLEADDEAAQQLCDHINVVEELLAEHE